MIINVQVNTQETTKYEFAMVRLNQDTTGLSSSVDIDFSTLLDNCNISNELSLDFLFISTVIYAIDKLIPRSNSIDNWTRQLQTEIPVAKPGLWNQNCNTLNSAISFLTGDLWSISFRELECSLVRPKRHRYKLLLEKSNPEIVSLFSGGLDSLIGALDLLESKPQVKIKFVGHYDPAVGGPKSDQNRLMDELKSHYRNRIKFVQIRAGQTPSGNEVSFRSRSVLFIGLGIYVASAAGESIDLLMPENGTIALNVPLTPSRRGSCSTRTAHPFFLKTINQVFEGVGIANRVINPFEFKTKGECVEQCRNRKLLESVFIHSVSCAKPHHRRTWIRRSARQCGRCMPCIYRRAALHKIGLDNEVFGRDFCLGEVELDSTDGLADDFRAYVSFMSNNPTSKEISDILLANGNIDIPSLPDYGGVVSRALDEIGRLLHDKATPRVKRQAGIIRN